MPPTLTSDELAKMPSAAKELYYKMQGIIHRPTVTDWTNDEQIKTAIMASINSDHYPAMQERYPNIPDMSDALSIAHRVQFEERRQHSHIVDIKRCLHQLVAENRIEYASSGMRDGKLREQYGPLATTDEERAKWDFLRQRLANM
jgi:hypothetical protein